ncbi:MAG: right-handed parallel beta-helix repeat-containing protein, partial [Deltaproteobacteria bacterium]|nr:right-handed parallel beta-helix repeat-containing protein [Deltaproteobacteria bacterium]
MKAIILTLSTVLNMVVIFALPVLAATIFGDPEDRKDFTTNLTAPIAVENTRVLTVGPDEQFATIQEAVNLASQGSTILVYPGIYNEEVVIDKNNLQILAQGEYVNVQPTEFDPDDKKTGFSIIADHVTIRGFNIGFGGGCFPAIGFRGSHNTFANNYMFQARDCPGVNAVNGRALVRGNDYNVIEGNTIDHADLGIAIGISPQSNGGFLHKGNIIRNNIIRRIVQTPIAIENGDGFLVSGNRIEGGAGFCIDVGTLGGNQPSQGHHTIVGNYM